MSYYSLSYLGIVRAWHRHTRGQIDHFIRPKGRIKGGSTTTVKTPPHKGNSIPSSSVNTIIKRFEFRVSAGTGSKSSVTNERCSSTSVRNWNH
jgi:hypothetical protein